MRTQGTKRKTEERQGEGERGEIEEEKEKKNFIKVKSKIFTLSQFSILQHIECSKLFRIHTL